MGSPLTWSGSLLPGVSSRPYLGDGFRGYCPTTGKLSLCLSQVKSPFTRLRGDVGRGLVLGIPNIDWLPSPPIDGARLRVSSAEAGLDTCMSLSHDVRTISADLGREVVPVSMGTELFSSPGCADTVSLGLDLGSKRDTEGLLAPFALIRFSSIPEM